MTWHFPRVALARKPAENTPESEWKSNSKDNVQSAARDVQSTTHSHCTLSIVYTLSRDGFRNDRSVVAKTD